MRDSVSTGLRDLVPADLIDSMRAECPSVDFAETGGGPGGGGGTAEEVFVAEADFFGGGAGADFFGEAGLFFDAKVGGGGGATFFLTAGAVFFIIASDLSTKQAIKLAVSLFSSCSCVIPALSKSCFQSSGIFLT